MEEKREKERAGKEKKKKEVKEGKKRRQTLRTPLKRMIERILGTTDRTLERQTLSESWQQNTAAIRRNTARSLREYN